MKKTRIEVLRDAAYPELDCDEIAHAIATVTPIKQLIEIICDNEALRVPDSQQRGVLDMGKVHVPRSWGSDIQLFYTGRKINDGVNGLYKSGKGVAVVSATSKDSAGTARHELGHAFFDLPFGRVSRTADIETDHCISQDCVMFESLTLPPASPLEGVAVPDTSGQIEQVDRLRPSDFCAECEYALVQSALLRHRVKNRDPALADSPLYRDYY